MCMQENPCCTQIEVILYSGDTLRSGIAERTSCTWKLGGELGVVPDLPKIGWSI